ncbi:MAG TPA: zf-HC2 domain-containing protein [Ktedonobacterales bacterium]|nr:zf-HC2 domain-containing protein [Ktedonobacterales bacterium]
MDNDTIQLDCQWAEDELSGYLDDVLDPRLRRRVEAHLAACERCRTILEDYRRADDLMRDLPFIEPPSDMRDRFFNSPEYLKLAKARARQRNFITPLSAALVAAALLVVALGGALLFRYGISGQQTAGKPGATAVIGNNGGGPLAAGARLIYERGGALWSAPESGAGLPAPLTPTGVQVAGWSVAPNGHMVIYINASTGALHSIRADGLNDKAIGTVTGGKAPSTGFWTTPAGSAIAQGVAWSPDNTRVAYLAQSANGGTALHVMNAAGAADAVAPSTGNGLIGHLLWSADSVYIAYTSTPQAGAQSVWTYNVTTAHARSLASRSDADDSAAVVGQLAWLSSGASATVTWSAIDAGDAGDAGKVTGVFRAGAKTGAALRLTPPGSSYAAAGVSPSGAWLLANGATLWEIAAGQTSPHVVAAPVDQIAQVHWSPSATVAAVVSGATLILVTPGQTPVVVAHGLTARSQVAWSPKGDALAWQAGQAVLSVPVRNGAVGAAKTVAANANASALAWAPDGQSLAVRSSTGLLLVTADGAHVRASDGKASGDRQFAWSIAG